MILEIAGLLLFLGVALFLLLPMRRGIQRQARQGRWPRVQALVAEHRIREEGHSGFREFRVQYEYGGVAHDRWVGVADGTRHTMLSDSRATNIYKAVRARMAKHPVGSQLAVMVNPENMDEAYFVERELPVLVIFFVVLGVFAVFLAMFAFVAFS